MINSVNPTDMLGEKVNSPITVKASSIIQKICAVVRKIFNAIKDFLKSLVTGREKLNCNDLSEKKNQLAELNNILDEWAKKQENFSSNNDCIEACKTKLKNYLKNPTGTLELLGFPFKELPDVFHLEAFQSIKKLELSFSDIEQLPGSLNLPKLETLILDYSKIKSLPEEFNLPNLIMLRAMSSKMEKFPESFNPPKLKGLLLTNSKIERLPENFNPPELVLLGIAGTNLERLPEKFCPPKLEELYIQATGIRNLPTGFNSPKLRVFFAEGSRLEHLPEGLLSPTLEELGLSGTELRSLPESLFNLPSTCAVELSLGDFALTVRNRIRDRVTADSYNGPRIEYDMAEAGFNSPKFNSLEEAMKELVAVSETEQSDQAVNILINNLTQGRSGQDKAQLNLWIGRLFNVASAKNSNKGQFFKAALEALKTASESQEIEDYFYFKVHEDLSSCDDRIALSFLHLEMQCQLNKLKIDNPKAVYDFLIKGVFTLDWLEKRAKNIVPTLGFTDPLEVFLGLPILFKEEFEIPISQKEMLHLSCAGLSELHIETARKDLREALADKKALKSFLMEQKKWIEVLKHKYPEEMKQMETAIDSFNDDDELTVEQAGKKSEEIRNNTLNELTEKLLSEF